MDMTLFPSSQKAQTQCFSSLRLNSRKLYFRTNQKIALRLNIFYKSSIALRKSNTAIIYFHSKQYLICTHFFPHLGYVPEIKNFFPRQMYLSTVCYFSKYLNATGLWHQARKEQLMQVKRNQRNPLPLCLEFLKKHFQ